ncbi:MAG: cobalt-precorrin-6A reductase [Rhodospirillales bacterium]
MSRRLLILGGTTEARQLAERTVARWGDDLTVTTSLAGRTRDAMLPAGEVRSGGFGGTAGLAAYLTDEAVDLVVDATHPFAAEISAHAADAAAAANVPRLLLVRPPWTLPEGLEVHRTPDIEGAAFALAALGASTVLVTIGHRGLEGLKRLDARLVVRQIETHEAPLPLDNAVRIVDRPPYTLAGELALMRGHGVDAVLTKESGGAATAAKLQAAADLGIPVVMIERPPLPPGDIADSVDAAMDWIAAQLDGLGP